MSSSRMTPKNGFEESLTNGQKKKADPCHLHEFFSESFGDFLWELHVSFLSNISSIFFVVSENFFSLSSLSGLLSWFIAVRSDFSSVTLMYCSGLWSLMAPQFYGVDLWPWPEVPQFSVALVVAEYSGCFTFRLLWGFGWLSLLFFGPDGLF